MLRPARLQRGFARRAHAVHQSPQPHAPPRALGGRQQLPHLLLPRLRTLHRVGDLGAEVGEHRAGVLLLVEPLEGPEGHKVPVAPRQPPSLPRRAVCGNLARRGLGLHGRLVPRLARAGLPRPALLQRLLQPRPGVDLDAERAPLLQHLRELRVLEALGLSVERLLRTRLPHLPGDHFALHLPLELGVNGLRLVRPLQQVLQVRELGLVHREGFLGLALPLERCAARDQLRELLHLHRKHLALLYEALHLWHVRVRPPLRHDLLIPLLPGVHLLQLILERPQLLGHHE
mmetsp:Transcript_62039/g.196145  ORF Transcript_62039/g.196145 Transcript_62039/m.196145 type:complete len:288 (+) Transcript_62039:1293-2156(+)